MYIWKKHMAQSIVLLASLNPPFGLKHTNSNPFSWSIQLPCHVHYRSSRESGLHRQTEETWPESPERGSDHYPTINQFTKGRERHSTCAEWVSYHFNEEYRDDEQAWAVWLVLSITGALQWQTYIKGSEEHLTQCASTGRLLSELQDSKKHTTPRAMRHETQHQKCQSNVLWDKMIQSLLLVMLLMNVTGLITRCFV